MEKNILINNKPLVSVLIGSFNREKLIPRCLDSILNQTYENIEIIVVDDASSDNTISVLENYVNNYPNQIQFIRNETNKGIAYNSNLAFSLSLGEYIALIGDDDYWVDRDKIKKQVNIFNISTKKLGVIGTWWVEKSQDIEVKKQPEEPENWKSRLLSGGGVICGSTPLIARKVWLDVGGFDEKMKKGTDSELFRRIIIKGYKAFLLKEFTTIVDVGHNSKRMTDIEGRKALSISLKMNLYLFYKYKYEFIRYPKALLIRIFKLVKKII